MARRHALFAAALMFAAALSYAAATASVDMATGIRYVIPSGSIDDCSAKAKTALGAYLQVVSESSPGSNEWVGYGPTTERGQATSAAAAVHCYPVGNGYVVTFDCSVQLPNNPYDASALCLDIAHNFSGKPVTPLATATPPPAGGCSTTSLAGKWTNRDSSGPSFQMDADGSLTASDGVSGSWNLYGNSVTLTYYGNHTLKLSADGTHLTGSGYDLTRKC